MIPVSDSLGLVSFFGPANIEGGIKILNVGGAWRVFSGQLTDFSLAFTVFDTETFQVVRAQGECFSSFTVAAATRVSESGSPLGAAVSAAGACKPGPNSLCLRGGRFRAELSWHNQFNDTSGEAKMIRQSDVAGLAYYTHRGNIEMLIKVLEIGGEVKLFYTPLSDLEYNLRLTEVAAGVTRTYGNGEADACAGLAF